MAVRKFVISALFTGLAAVTLVGCGEEDKPKEAVQVYSDVDQCKAEHSEQDCVQAFEGAQSDHESSAPHMTLGQCVDSYGASACLPRRDSSGDFFVPAMAGFALGMMANSSHSVYQPVYVDLSGRAYYHSTPIGTFHPGCYGCGGTTVVHVYPQARSWSQSYERKPLAPEQRTAKPSPPAYSYGQPSQTERGGFSRPGNMASPAAKTIQTSPSAYSPTPSQSPSSSPSTTQTQRGGFGSPGPSAAPAAKTYQSPPSTPSTSSPSTSSFHSAPSAPSRGGFSSRGK